MKSLSLLLALGLGSVHAAEPAQPLGTLEASTSASAPEQGTATGVVPTSEQPTPLPTPAIADSNATAAVSTTETVAFPIPFLLGDTVAMPEVGAPSAPTTLIPVNIGIAPGNSTNGAHPETKENHVSLDLLAGEAGNISGVQASLGMNTVLGDMHGLQASGGLNQVQDSMVGVQLSTVNLVKGNVHGAQFAQILNRVEGNTRGAQISWLGNLNYGKLEGLQFSAFYGQSQSVKGAQINAVGVADTLHGLQFGFLNVAKSASGVQFGLVNVARSGDVAQIGLVNIHPQSRMHSQVWLDETRSAHLALDYGTPRWYALLEVMASEREPHPVGAGLGFGVRTLGDINTVSLDVSALAVADDEGERGRGRHHRATDTDDGSVNALLRSRLTYNCQFLSHFGIITGLSYNVLLVSDRTQNDRLLLPMGSYQYDPTPEVRLWPGAFIGLRF